jgi:hypothetical protein
LFSLERVGVGAQAARIALGDLQKRLGRTNFQKFFRQFGLDPKALAKLSRAEQLDTVLRRLVELRDAGVDIAGITGLLFEEQAGKDILKLVLQYERGVEARKDYDRIVGKGTTKQDEKELLELTGTISNLNLAWTVLKRKIVLEVGPEITDTLEELLESGQVEAFTKDVLALAKAFVQLSKDVRFFAAKMAPTIEALQPLFKLLQFGGITQAAVQTSKLPFALLRKQREVSERKAAREQEKTARFVAPKAQAPVHSIFRTSSASAVTNNVSVTNNFSGVNESRMPGKVAETINREIAQ